MKTVTDLIGIMLNLTNSPVNGNEALRQLIAESKESIKKKIIYEENIDKIMELKELYHALTELDYYNGQGLVDSESLSKTLVDLKRERIPKFR